MWIQKLILDEFQSHKHTEINFHPHFNCIVGTGNAGKTAVVRALAFILYGQWEPSWVRHGAKFCKITLITNTGTIVIREKGEKVNKFIVKDVGKQEQIYENFGIDVPKEVEQILGIFKVQLDSTEYLNLNISQQMDPLFLLSKPGSFKAKVLGKLSGAHLLDYVLRELNKDKRNLKSEKQLKSEEELNLRKELIQYENLEAEKIKLEKINEKIIQVTKKIEYLQRVKNLFFRVNTWKEQYIQKCTEKELLAKINLDKVQNLEYNVNFLNKLQQLQEKINFCKNEIIKVNTELTQLEEKQAQKIDEYIELLQNTKKCPTCFSDVGENQLEVVKKNL